MRVALIPGNHVNDEEVIGIWDRICEEGKKEVLFYAGDITTLGEFVRQVRSQGTHFFVIKANDDTAGMFWLNGWEDYAARIHYIFFKRYYRYCLHIAKEGLKRLMALERADGTPFVKVLIGVTPISNRLAVKFLQKVGFIINTEIPHLCLVNGETEPGVISHFTGEAA